MYSVVLHAPHLGRDLSALREKVPDLHVHAGPQTERGEDGCLDMHVAVIRAARDRMEPRLFVLEDDAQLTEAFDWDRWNADAAWAQAHGYHVMVGGCTRTYNERVVREGMIAVSAFHSAHCYAIFQSGYAKALHAVQPYDLSLGRDCGLRCVLTWPFVAVQRPSHSGILQQPVDYVPLYHAHEARLGHALGMLQPFQAMEAY